MVRTRRLLIGCCVWSLVLLWACGSATNPAMAGMPAILPSGLTAEEAPEASVPFDADEASRAQSTRILPALLFLALGWLVSAGGVQRLWNSLCTSVTVLPRIGYARALLLVLAWAALLVVVLGMISSARELLTPGAWKKQGWTYRLSNDSAQAEVPPQAEDGQARRRRALEELRIELLFYAAGHNGQFPDAETTLVNHDSWRIPGWGNTRYIYVPGRNVNMTARLLAYEPELDDDERFVLLTNGIVRTMRTVEIERLLAEKEEADPTLSRPTEDQANEDQTNE